MSNPAGTWNTVVSSPFGPQELQLEIVVDGSAVSGAAVHSAGRFPFEGGTYQDDTVTFEVALTVPVTADLKVKMKADGDKIEGKAKTGVLSFGVSGTRA